MTGAPFRLKNAPIREAILDLDCDMPPNFSLVDLEPVATAAFKDYPKLQKQFIQEFQVVVKEGKTTPGNISTLGVQAMRFSQEDGKQLVQARANGFSFNRLAPYGGFDDYIPEIQRTWNLFVGFAKPVHIRSVRLRYINRILLPEETDGNVNLEKHLRVGPRLPSENSLTFSGFLNQHSAVENTTGHMANIILTTQPFANKELPLLFDITVEAKCNNDPRDWAFILAKISSLRSLKNTIFRDTLTPECLSRFQ